MINNTDFLISVHNATNEAVLEYFDDSREAVTQYTSPNGFLNIIQSKQLWFGNIINVNDTTEIDYAFKNVIYPCINSYKFANASLRKKIFSFITRLKERKFSFVVDDKIEFKKASIFVFSTSFDSNSTMLWQLYCKNSENKGYSITFDKTTFSANLHECNIRKRDERRNHADSDKYSHHYLIEGKVVYDREKQIEIINDYLSHLEYAIEQQNSDTTIQAITDIYVQKFLLIALFMKDSDFDKENEYRFAVVCDDEFIDANNDNPPFLVFGTNSGNIVSRLAVPFGGEIVKSITISPFIYDVKAVQTTKYFLDKNGFSNIDILHNDPKVRITV